MFLCIQCNTKHKTSLLYHGIEGKEGCPKCGSTKIINYDNTDDAWKKWYFKMKRKQGKKYARKKR